MSINLEVSFRNFTAPILAQERIEERVSKLTARHPRMTALHVIAEQIQRRHKTGKLYRLSLVASLPGQQIAVDKAHADKHAHEDFYVAMRDAFNALEHRLEKFTEKQNGDIKAHEVQPHGTIKGIFPNYGFIETPEGFEIYFHANSVVDGKFSDLRVGSEVRYTVSENESDKGPQASTVHVIGKHHLVG